MTSTSELERTTSWPGSGSLYAGVIAEPKTERRGRRQYVSTQENGMHALRHYYAGITLADAVNINELPEYLGHGDPRFTLRALPRPTSITL